MAKSWPAGSEWTPCQRCWSLRYLHERLASWRFTPTLSYVAAHRIRVIDILHTFLKLNSCRSYLFLVTVPFSGPLWGIREINITDQSKNTLRFLATTSHAWSGSKLCIRNMEHDSNDVLWHKHKLPQAPHTSTNKRKPCMDLGSVCWIIHTFFCPNHWKFIIAPWVLTLLRWGSTRLLEFIGCWDAQG